MLSPIPTLGTRHHAFWPVTVSLFEILTSMMNRSNENTLLSGAEHNFISYNCVFVFIRLLNLCGNRIKIH